VYSARVVIEALKGNGSLECQWLDVVGCPRRGIYDDGKEICESTPEKCKKGHNQECIQRVKVCRKNEKIPLRVIEFRFMRSPTDASGFIRRADSALQSLVRNKIIAL
jgi:hypothetical protein